MAQWIKASGEVVEVEPTITGKKKAKFTLDQLQEFVGGYIERVQIGPNRDMICNEEGRLRGLKLNNKASSMAQQTIVGDVLVVERGKW
jgi:hypothetical protein